MLQAIERRGEVGRGTIDSIARLYFNIEHVAGVFCAERNGVGNPRALLLQQAFSHNLSNMRQKWPIAG